MDGFWWFMLVMVLLIPLFQVLCGLFWGLLGRIPRYGGIVGYKTPRSGRSPAAWRLAHRCFGRWSFFIGLGALVLGVAVMLLCAGGDKDTVGTVGSVVTLVQCVLLMIPILPTELRLKRAMR